MEIKESDVDILDKFLDNLCLNKNVDVDFLYSSGIIQYDLRNPSKANKEAKDLLDRYNLYISAYCGEVKIIGFGSYYYIKDDRTSNFKIDGGFKGLYIRQLEERRKNDAKDDKQSQIDDFTLDNLRYKKKIRILEIISLLLAIYGAIMTIIATR